MIVSPQKEESSKTALLRIEGHRDFSSPNFATSAKEIGLYEEYDSKEVAAIRICDRDAGNRNNAATDSPRSRHPTFQRRSRSIFLMLPGQAL